ncbi:MAG TPA: hypothetical protein DCP20_06525 [Coriobacteriia bacterium]|nr:hypothetical protein [Coriobacteriia bacterium]
MSLNKPYIAETARRLRDSDRLDEALAFLEAQVELARIGEDPEDESEALAWLSTTLWLIGMKDRGLEAARAATVAAERVSESCAIQAWLRLATLLTNAGKTPDPEAGDILAAVGERTARHADSRYEDLRLQRLETYHRKCGRADDATAAREALLSLRARGEGFAESEQTRPRD